LAVGTKNLTFFLTVDFRVAKVQLMQHGREQLAAWLRRSKLKQCDFARQIHITDAYLSQVLSGKRRPSLPIAVRIEDQTGIPVRSWLPLGVGQKRTRPAKPAHNPHISHELTHAGES
jgi:transcriptional regulator with XRE-family HTH domain